jgi:predicted transcriptional regulator of viral defense system
MTTPSYKAIDTAARIFARHEGVMRTSDALAAGIHRRTLYWMRDAGQVEPLSRGVYHLTSHELPAKPDVAAVMRRTPKAVLCLVSALDLHEVGTQIPGEVQIALPRNVRPPRIDYPRVRVFHMSPASLSAGVEERDAEGVTLRVFNLAKTVADCFKYRGSVGSDVAIEALQEVIRERRVAPGEIMEYARVDRVQNVIRPYLEALL